MRPGKSAIENVDRSILYFLRPHDLHAEDTCGKVALLDLIEEIFDMIIRFGACQSLGGLAVHCFDAGFGSEMPFDVNEAAVLVSSVNANECCKVYIAYLLIQGVCVHAKSVDVR